MRTGYSVSATAEWKRSWYVSVDPPYEAALAVPLLKDVQSRIASSIWRDDRVRIAPEAVDVKVRLPKPLRVLCDKATDEGAAQAARMAAAKALARALYQTDDIADLLGVAPTLISKWVPVEPAQSSTVRLPTLELSFFESDAVMDWVGDLVRSRSLRVVERAIRAAQVDLNPTEPDTLLCAIAACEVLAKLRGNPRGGDTTDDIDQWILRYAGVSIPREFLRQARALVSAIVSNFDDYQWIWRTSSDYREWMASVRDLDSRLAAAKRPVKRSPK